jgi:hypothetical protein
MIAQAHSIPYARDRGHVCAPVRQEPSAPPPLPRRPSLVTCPPWCSEQCAVIAMPGTIPLGAVTGHRVFVTRRVDLRQ